MNRNYNSTHNIVALILLISLVVQSCGGHSFKQMTYQEDKHALLKEQINVMPLLGKTLTAEKGYLVTFYEQDGRLRADVSADEKQPVPNYIGIPVVIEQGTNLSALTKLDVITKQNRIQLKCNKYRRIERILIFNCGVSGGMMEADDYPEKEDKKEKNINDEKQLPDVRPRINQDDTEKPGSYRHQNNTNEIIKLAEKRKREKGKQERGLVQIQDKRRKINVENEKDESVMNLVTFFEEIARVKKKKQQEKEDKGEEREKNEVLRNIFQHFSFRTILNLTLANGNLYKIINQWNAIAPKGLDIVVPEKTMQFNPYKINPLYSDFGKNRYTPNDIPSVIFYRIIRRVSNIPKEYWTYISKTQIKEIDLTATGITDNDFTDLWKYLKNSNVRKIHLGYNHITDEGINKIIEKTEEIENPIEINLESNPITKQAQEKIKNKYPNITWLF